MATRASVLNNALGRCISNLFPRSCHASTRPSVPVRRSLAVSLPACPTQILRQACLRLFCGIFAVIADRNVEANMRRVSVSAASASNNRCNRRGRGWCEFVNPFGHVNWKNAGQLVGTN